MSDAVRKLHLTGSDSLQVEGQNDLLVYRARCCNPIRGEGSSATSHVERELPSMLAAVQTCKIFYTKATGVSPWSGPALAMTQPVALSAIR